jgi:adenylate kinase
MNDNQQIDKIKEWLGSGSINIFGRPFAGKDNQCARLQKILGGNILGGGDILRGSVIPESSKKALSAGKLVPSEDYVNIVLPFLSKPEFNDSPLILSSVGRWSGEEQGVVSSLEKSNHPLRAVVYLNISDEDSLSRWNLREICNDRQTRHDDTVEILQTRFKEFQEKTIPVIDYYRNSGLLIEIDGRKTREQVTSDIVDAIYDKLIIG